MPPQQTWAQDLPKCRFPQCRVENLLPFGYDAYLRLFHPFVPWDWPIDTPVPDADRTTWRSLSAKAEVAYNATVTWRLLESALPEAHGKRPLAVWEGHLELNTASALLQALDGTETGHGPYYFAYGLSAVIGSADHEPLTFKSTSTLALGDVRQATRFRAKRMLAGPELIWPSDRRWLVHTDYDSDSTYLAVDAAAADRVAKQPRLETLTVELDTRIGSRADEGDT